METEGSPLSHTFLQKGAKGGSVPGKGNDERDGKLLMTKMKVDRGRTENRDGHTGG